MLTFAAPALAVAGLAAALVPLLIHLLWRRRRAPVEWAAMELLAKAIRRRRRRLELERLLLLAVRMAVLVLLGLAIAQPLLSGAGGPVSKRVWIVLDDGAASKAQPGGGADEFSILRSEAEGLLDALGEQGAAGVVLASRPPRVLAAISTDLAGVRSRLQSIEASLAPSDLAGAIALARGGAGPESADPASRSADPIVVLSAFRKGSMPREPLAPPEDGAALLLREPAEAAIRNVRVERIEASRSPAGDPSALLQVRLGREGSLEESSSRVTVSGPSLPQAIERSVAWPAGRAAIELDLSIPLPATSIEEDVAKLAIAVSVDPDGQPADDRRHATLDARSRVRVGLVGGGMRGDADWIAKALSPSRDAPVEIASIEPGLLDSRSIRSLDALVLLRPDRIGGEGWLAARELVDRGGTVWVIPPGDLEAHEWLDRLAAFEPLGAGWSIARQAESKDRPWSIDPRRVDAAWLPAVAGEAKELTAPVSVSRFLAFEASPPQDEVVLAISASEISEASGADEGAVGRPMPLVVASADPGSGGSLVLFTIAPDLAWSDLPIRPLMVPLVQELLRSGLARGESGRRLVVGMEGSLPPPAARLIGPSGAAIEVDASRRLEALVAEAGVHRVVDLAGREFDLVAANVDLDAASAQPTPRDTVALAFGGEAAVRSLAASAMPEALGGEAAGTPIASLLAWIALGLALLEILLARRFSHAARERRRDDGAMPAFLEGYVASPKGRGP